MRALRVALLTQNPMLVGCHSFARVRSVQSISSLSVRFNQTVAATPQIKTSTFRRRPKVDALVLTDAAVSRIKTLLLRKPEALGIKLGVKTRGCNGLSYTLDYLMGEPKASEDVVETRGVKVVIEPKALIHLVGTTMDYKEDALSAEFVFQNPNAKGSCGCGESFNV
jgi:iron-sulfur cluster assembly protein